MKYTKPGKVKQAVKELIYYIEDENGVSDTDEWREKIDSLKQEYVDPRDWDTFEKVVSQLEVQGLIVAEAYQFMNKVWQEFWTDSQKILKGIKNEKSKKSNR